MTSLKRFHFVADDFGLNSEVNQSILNSHNQGALTDAALMMGQPGTAEAIDLALAHPSLSIGLHFHFFDSIPTLSQAWTWSRSPESFGLQITWSSRMKSIVRNEIRSQWELFHQSKLPLSFINVHHHLHAHPWIALTLGEFLKEKGFSGWIRAGYARFFSKSPFQQLLSIPIVNSLRKRAPYPTPESLWGIDRPFSMNPEEIQKIISKLTTGHHEFIFHPRHPNDRDTQCLIQLKSFLQHSSFSD